MHVHVHVIYFVRIFQSSFFSVLLFIAYLVHIYFTDFILVYIILSDCGLIIFITISQLFTFFSIFNFDSYS